MCGTMHATRCTDARHGRKECSMPRLVETSQVFVWNIELWQYAVINKKVFCLLFEIRTASDSYRQCLRLQLKMTVMCGGVPVYLSVHFHGLVQNVHALSLCTLSLIILFF